MSYLPTGVWSHTFENRLLAVVEVEAEAEDRVRLSAEKSGVSNSLLSCCDKMSQDCEAMLLINYVQQSPESKHASTQMVLHQEI